MRLPSLAGLGITFLLSSSISPLLAQGQCSKGQGGGPGGGGGMRGGGFGGGQRGGGGGFGGGQQLIQQSQLQQALVQRQVALQRQTALMTALQQQNTLLASLPRTTPVAQSPVRKTNQQLTTLLLESNKQQQYTQAQQKKLADLLTAIESQETPMRQVQRSALTQQILALAKSIQSQSQQLAMLQQQAGLLEPVDQIHLTGLAMELADITKELQTQVTQARNLASSSR